MSTLNQELNAIKAVEDTLTANKVANFAYTQEAYDNNDADGVEEYDFDNEQNIPVGSLSVLKVNETVLTKGWRSQASAITRMLMNHFLGRLSYNLNKLNDNVSRLLSTLIAKAGNADGFATLDSNGRIPYSQLPESAIEYKGQWDASTNTPTLADGTGTKGDFYIVSVAGTQDLGSGDIQFFVNDRVIYDGSVWSRLSAGDVKSVNNITPVNGNITLGKGDIGLGNVVNTGDEDIPTAGSTKKFTSAGAYNTLISIAPVFDTTVTYNVDDLVTYQGKLYICTVNHTGAWDATHFTLTSLNKYIGTVSNPVKDEIKAFSAGGAWSLLTALVGRFLTKIWTQGTGANTTYTMQHLAYANGLWVCGSLSHGVWWSEDGKTWTQGAGALSNKRIDFLVYSGDIFVCGNNTEGGFLGLWWSEDGKNWTQSSATTSFSYIHDLQYANGLWQCAVYNQGFWWSEDGKNWTKGTGFSSNLSANKVVYGNNRWVGIDWAGGLWSSANGKTWQAITISELVDKSGLYSVEIKFANGLFQYLMSYTYHSEYIDFPVYLAFWSNDGINWTLSNLNDTEGEPPTISTVYVYTHIIYAGGKWFVFGSSGLQYSSDGKSWSSPSGSIASNDNINTVVYGNGTWLCVTTSNGIWWSVDANTWTKGTGANTSYTMQYLFYANGLWVCGSVSHGIWLSEDGKVWTQVTGANTSYTMQYLVYANGLWVCGSTNHGIWHGRDLNDLIADGALTL